MRRASPTTTWGSCRWSSETYAGAASRLGRRLVGDALAAPQGRVEVLVVLEAPLNHWVQFRAGYRALEGGADTDAVYTFTLIHYTVVATTFGF